MRTATAEAPNRPPPDARPAATAPRASATPVPTGCADAVQRVQQYRAPGATIPLIQSLERQLAAERRPVKIDGWLQPEGSGNTCWAYFRVYIGNDRKLFGWSLNRTTGRVEARDDETKRYSGW